MIFRPHKPPETNIRGAFERHFRDTAELVFHIHLSQKVSIFDEFPAPHLHYKYHDLEPCLALPGLAQESVDRELGSKVYPPHVPMSQYIVNLAERKLPQTTTASERL